jgi:hypothetical protein
MPSLTPTVNKKLDMLDKIRQKKTRIKIKLGPDFVKAPIKFSLAINLIILLITFGVYPFIQPLVPLFYSLSDPSQHLADKSWLFLLPVISLVMNLIHIYSLKLIETNSQFVIKLFAYSGLTLQTILLMITLRNILIVFRIF